MRGNERTDLFASMAPVAGADTMDTEEIVKILYELVDNLITDEITMLRTSEFGISVFPPRKE